MVTSPSEDIRERLTPVLILAGRITLGVCLALVLSMVGIVVGWGLFLFSGSQSLTTWLSSLYFGAGLGAGISGMAAWVRIDHETHLTLATALVVGVSIGVVGAWGGYQYGQNREIECCAMPTASPVYFTALGATVAANIGVIILVAIRGFISRKRSSDIQNYLV